jgi:hypothetical protein
MKGDAAVKTKLRDLNSMLAIQFGTGIQFRRHGKIAVMHGPVVNNLRPEWGSTIALERNWFSHPHSELLLLVCKLLDAALVRTIGCRHCGAVEPFDGITNATTAGWTSPIFTPAGRVATWMATCPACARVKTT